MPLLTKVLIRPNLVRICVMGFQVTENQFIALITSSMNNKQIKLSEYNLMNENSDNILTLNPFNSSQSLGDTI